MARRRQGPQSVAVKGLDELRRELRRLDDAGLLDELKTANFEVASSVVEWAQAEARRFGPMDVAAADTLSAARGQRAAEVRLGGAKAPWAGGSEFGAGRNMPRSTSRGTVTGWQQFRPWRGNGRDAGYWLYPAIRSHTDQIVETYGDALEQITARAFPD
jgi:hypothetical protein